MVKLKLLSVIFLLFKMIYGILASSHWVVTEKGLIQPLFDSPFQMRVPNDLMGFLEQERRLKEIDGIYKTLKDFVFDKPFLEGSATMPSKVHKTSYYCEKTTIPIDDIDLYMSIAADGSDRDGIKLVDFFADNSLRNIYGTEVPNCEKSSALPFSMFTFEHLKAMVQRQNLSLAPEHSLHEWLLPGTSVTSFGHQVALGLLHNSTSWLHYNLAAIYWRIKGEATKALECSRRAVHFAPRQYRDISLLNMGSIFHQTKNYADAAIVLHAAIDHDPLQPANYFALGNVYAVLEDYNQSVACYDNVLKLKPSFKQARINKYAVLCKAHHINELLELNDAIQNKYAEVRDFLKLKEDWQKLEEKLMNELAPLGFKSFGNVEGDVSEHSNLNSENDKTDSPETWQIRSSSRMFSNMLESHQTFNPFEIVISIQMLLKNLESELRKLSPRYKLTDDFALVKMNERNEYSVNVKKINGETNADVNVGDNSLDVTNLESVLVPPLTFYMSDVPDDYDTDIDRKNDENIDVTRKTLQTKYPPTTKISRIKQDFDKQSDWPSQEECDLWAPLITKRVGKMGEPLELLPLYLPVENKGYDTKKILSENIMLSFDVEHPLPWYPPLCCSEVQPNIRTSYLPSALLIKSKSSPSFPTENRLRQILISFVTDSNVDSNKHNIQEAEIGQRILTAIKKSAAPKWVLYTLASLYWRVRGNVQNTLDCLLCAIELTPESTKDVPLTSLGSVFYELGYIEDSIKVSAEAYTINKIEPTTNFLLSMLHKSKNNVLGQLYHMKQVIRVDPDFMQGWAYTLLRGWHCIAKSIMKLKFSNVETAAKTKSPDVCSDISKEKIKDDPESIGGDMMGMICTAGGETCQPANIQCYKTDTQSSEDEYVSYSMMRDVVEKNFPEQTELHCISTSDDRVSGGNEKGTTATCKLKKVYYSTDKKMSNSDKVSSEFTEKSPLIMTIKTERPQQDQQENDEKKDKIRGKFQLRLVPPEDLDKDIKELGYMKVDGETYDIANLESWVTKMHIYDQSLSLQLSDDICAKMEKVDVFKSSSFWNAYSQREFFDSVQSLLPEYSGSDITLKPFCNAAQGDFVLDALGSENLPPLPQYSTHNFLSLLRRVTGDHDSSLNDLGGKIAEALKINHASWIPSFLAAIFWRIEGNPDLVVACLRQSLHLAPEREKDVSLVGLSFFFQWLGMNEDSMKSARMAYKKRPDFAVNLFHIAMVHAHTGELEHAIHILRKVIRQDNNFIVAEHSINELLCLLLFGLNDFLKEGTLSSLLKVFL